MTAGTNNFHRQQNMKKYDTYSQDSKKNTLRDRILEKYRILKNIMQ